MKAQELQEVMKQSTDILDALEFLLSADEETVISALGGELDEESSSKFRFGMKILDDYYQEKEQVKRNGVPSFCFLKYVPNIALLEDKRLKAIHGFYMAQRRALNEYMGRRFLSEMLKRCQEEGFLAASGQSSDRSSRLSDKGKLVFVSEDGRKRLVMTIVNNRLEFFVESPEDEVEQPSGDCSYLHLGTLPAVKLEDGLGEMEIRPDSGDYLPVVLELEDGRSIGLRFDDLQQKKH